MLYDICRTIVDALLVATFQPRHHPRHSIPDAEEPRRRSGMDVRDPHTRRR